MRPFVHHDCAARIAELEAERDQLQKTFKEISDTNDELDRENTLLRKALEDMVPALGVLASVLRAAGLSGADIAENMKKEAAVLARIPEAKPPHE